MSFLALYIEDDIEIFLFLGLLLCFDVYSTQVSRRHFGTISEGEMHIRKPLFGHYPASLSGSPDDVAVGTVCEMQTVDVPKYWWIMKVPATKTLPCTVSYTNGKKQEEKKAKYTENIDHLVMEHVLRYCLLTES